GRVRGERERGAPAAEGREAGPEYRRGGAPDCALGGRGRTGGGVCGPEGPACGDAPALQRAPAGARGAVPGGAGRRGAAGAGPRAACAEAAARGPGGEPVRAGAAGGPWRTCRDRGASGTDRRGGRAEL